MALGRINLIISYISLVSISNRILKSSGGKFRPALLSCHKSLRRRAIQSTVVIFVFEIRKFNYTASTRTSLKRGPFVRATTVRWWFFFLSLKKGDPTAHLQWGLPLALASKAICTSSSLASWLIALRFDRMEDKASWASKLLKDGVWLVFTYMPFAESQKLYTYMYAKRSRPMNVAWAVALNLNRMRNTYEF